MFSIFELLAAFGGGILGASIGALPAFIMTGVTCLIGQAGGSGAMVGNIAFGSMFGPHVAFAGGVAAAAYAHKVGKLENGADICTAGFGLNDPMVLLVGGIFGIIGYLVKYAFGLVFGGTVSPKLATDLPGITVFVSGCVARLAFGKGGLLTPAENRKALSSGAALTNTLLVAVGYSLVAGGVFVSIAEAGLVDPSVLLDGAVAGWNVTMFGIAAVGLIFAQTGFAYFGCHHIMIISAFAAMMAYTTMGAFGALIAAVICGVVSALLCDFETNFFNSTTESHIDGPAFAIFIMTFVVNAIWA